MSSTRSFFSHASSAKSLSERRNRFLKDKEHAAYQLIVEDYQPIIQHYINKYGFENLVVLINGTDLSPKNKTMTLMRFPLK